MAKKIILIILGLLVVGGAFWYVDKKFIRTKGTNSGSAVPESDSRVTPLPTGTNEDTTEKMIFLVNSESSKEIVKSDVRGDKKTLFSDADEEFKIQKVGGLAYYSSEVLILSGNGDAAQNKLEVVKTDGSGKKTTLVNSFGNPSSFAISPDGKEIAYVSFSNVEADYGYNIYTIARDGSNLRKEFTATKEIKGLSWNKDSSKIAFIKSEGSDKSTIQVTDIGSQTSNEIFSTDKVILSLIWSESGKISFSIASLGNLAQSELWVTSPDGSNQKKILTEEKGAIISPDLSSDNLNVAYVLSDLKDKIDENAEGVVYVGKSSGKNIKKIQKGNLIIGWSP